MNTGEGLRSKFEKAIQQQRSALSICRNLSDRNNELLDEIAVGLDELLDSSRSSDADFWASHGDDLNDKLVELHKAIAAESRR